jgi:integrase
MTTIKVRLRRSTVPGKEGSLFYSLVYKKKTKQITSNYKLYPTEWNEAMQMVVPTAGKRGNDLLGIQQLIKKDIAVLTGIIKTLEGNGDYTLEEVVRQFTATSFSMTLFSYLDEQILKLQTGDRPGTARNYLRARSSFARYRKNRDIELSAITEELICDYELWLKKQKVSRNTISFYMRILRSVYNKAAEKHLVTQNYPFSKVYTGIERTHKRAIDEVTLAQLKKADLSRNHPLIYARDLFLFSFYTRGMAFVDMAYLKKSDIRNGVIHYIRRKTGQSMSIRLESCMQEIIGRYAPKTKDSEYLLPIITTSDADKAYAQYLNALSYYNKQLKRLSRFLELSKPLASYVSRHSWATVARNRNIPLSVISAGMGHTSEATTQIYLASLDASVVDDANTTIINGLEQGK